MIDGVATVVATREAVLAALRERDRFVLVTHEHPDGDALGSIVAMQALLRALGKDSVMVISPDDFPLPKEYRFLALDGLVTEPPADLDGCTAIFLDCGNIDRNPYAVLRNVEPLLNIDHHHDNTRFGTTNHVVDDASCTAELVWDLVHGAGVELTATMAEALYVGLLTDSGRFCYENTGPRAHLMAAELIEAGVDVAVIYRRIYEDIPLAKLRLLARALASVTLYCDGRLAVAWLSAEDFAASGAEDSDSEGIIDHLRALAGVKVALLARERVGEGRGTSKVSLRATDGEIDVSEIARSHGGGGHRRAAGFTTDAPLAALVASICPLV
jgi:phosphoesterase RecJ-like protein